MCELQTHMVLRRPEVPQAPLARPIRLCPQVMARRLVNRHSVTHYYIYGYAKKFRLYDCVRKSNSANDECVRALFGGGGHDCLLPATPPDRARQQILAASLSKRCDAIEIGGRHRRIVIES
jgi:hypothetical protein